MNKKIPQLLIWTFVTFAITFVVLFLFHLVPDELLPANSGQNSSVTPVALTAMTYEADASNQWVTETDATADPRRIVIAKIGVNSPVKNPTNVDPAILDQNLLLGAVHYPGSGSLKDTSNIFFFGHSTSHAVVKNEVYKTFNRLNELNIGDEIRVESVSDVYIYRVSAISKVQASEALVTLSNRKRMLTLSTCDSFGTKSERFVVEAEFIRSIPLIN